MHSPGPEPDCEVITTHGVANCETCAKAASWALTQVQIIGTAVGRDRIMNPPGIYHKATARFTTNERI